MSLLARVTEAVFGTEIKRQVNARVHAAFASAENERTIVRGIDWNGVYRDRYNYQRDQVLEEALKAWRLNPLARRIVEITKEFTIDGIEWDCDHPATKKFLTEFWNHDLNCIDEQLGEWSDELVLAGNLFMIFTTDPAGMSYVRVYPTDLMSEIETADNDVRQEKWYMPKATEGNEDPKAIKNYRTYKAIKPRHVMMHYAVNRLAGMKWGEPDIAPLLPWLARYASWLEDRVRLNRYRQAYVWDVLMDTSDEAKIQVRKKELLSNPPKPGDINVHGKEETWQVMSPKLESGDAEKDGLSVKKFIAGGRGVPLHWLAEPESSTRTTAEAAGTPTFKHFEERQSFFKDIVKDILTVAIERRAQRGDTEVDPKAKVEVRAADITERDNAALALATSQIVSAGKMLVDDGYITADEYLRLVYRFAGEVLPGDGKGNLKPKKKQVDDGEGMKAESGIKVDAETGDVKTEAEKVE